MTFTASTPGAEVHALKRAYRATMERAVDHLRVAVQQQRLTPLSIEHAHRARDELATAELIVDAWRGVLGLDAPEDHVAAVRAARNAVVQLRALAERLCPKSS